MNLRKLSILILSAISLAAMVSCRGAPPKVDLPLWAARHESESIVRSQAGQEVKCTDPKFNGFVCTEYDKLKRVLDLLWSCERWPKGMQKMNAQEVQDAMELYKMVSKKAEGDQE